MTTKQIISSLYDYVHSNIDNNKGRFEIEFSDGSKKDILLKKLSFNFDLNKAKSSYELIAFDPKTNIEIYSDFTDIKTIR